jgi:RNA polymerase sigma-70 factor (ECF subfamily)
MRIADNALSDAEIVRQVLDGNIDAFETLIHRYQRYVFSIAGRHLPPDEIEAVAQDVFIRAYQSLMKIKKAGSFKQWLSAITIRSCYDFWRKAHRTKEIAVTELTYEQKNWLEQTIADESEDLDKNYQHQKEAKQILEWLLSQLNPAEKMVLELVHLEGHTVKEAAELLGWSATNVKVRAFRARQKLQKLIQKIGMQR